MKKKEKKILQNIKYTNSMTKLTEFSKKINNFIINNKNIIRNNKNISIPKSLIILQNLKKYSITKERYNIYIINSIIFDQKSHIVTEFKNYLLWDESSEFLKRFYNLYESFDRLPSISQYYEIYTLFAPKYFGLESPLIIIMNDWTKKKKNYLEYIEDKEDKKKNKEYIEKNTNFKNIINNNLICSESSQVNSKKTIELTKYDNVDSFFIKENNDLNFIEKYKSNNISNKKDISLSKIMEDLSSNYSIYISNAYNVKKNEEIKLKNYYDKNLIIKNKNKINKKNKNINLSDKVLFSFTNLYKNRNKIINNQKYSKRYYYGTSNNSTSKNKKSYIYEKNKENKKEKKDSKIQINMHLNDVKHNNIKNKNKTNNNNLQITMNNFTRNKTSLKDKKDNVKKHALTNTNTNINVTSYNNSTNNSLSKNKIRKQKIKKLYLRNLKIITQNSNINGQKVKRRASNTIDRNQNENTNNNSKNRKSNLIRLLTCKDGKYKNYLLNGNIIIFKNFNSYRYMKPNNNQNNFEPFSNKINKLIKEKRITTSTNSFSNNNKKNQNSKKEKNQKNKINTNIRNFILLNKKMSNGNLIRNLVLTQFHSRKEIMNKKKKFNVNHKKVFSLTKNMTSRNSSLKSKKKISFNGNSNKRLNESLNINPYKKELNKINLNFNFNINFNIDVNKNRKKRYLFSHKNNGFLTQRNQIIKINNNNNKSKCKDGENLIKKNPINLLIRNKDYNLGLKKNI